MWRVDVVLEDTNDRPLPALDVYPAFRLELQRLTKTSSHDPVVTNGSSTSCVISVSVDAHSAADALSEASAIFARAAGAAGFPRWPASVIQIGKEGRRI